MLPLQGGINMKLTIDRIEGEFVVCETYGSAEIINLDRTIFPAGIRSGDLVEFIDGAITLLPNEETEKRIQEKMNNLWK